MSTDLKRAMVNELHKPARRYFKRRRVLIKGLHDLFQCDLVQMISYAKMNNGFKYILTYIDVFNKYTWALPVKRKIGKDVTDAMKNILVKPNIPANLKQITEKNSIIKILPT